MTPETKALVLDNVCHLLGNFLRCSAYENVVFGWVMHERAIVEGILARLPIAECGAEVRWVSLVASEEELRGRVERDVDAGLREADAAAEPAWDPTVSDRDLLNAERISRFD